MIPFKGSKRGIREFLRWWGGAPDNADAWDTIYDFNTIKLSLDIQCTDNRNADRDEVDPRKRYHHAHVYAKDIKFECEGAQEQFFTGDDIIKPCNPDILIAKMRPGQKINLLCHMHKGKGSDHAKFSPVATATYRLMPKITILEPIIGKDAEKFARCFPKGVIGLGKVPQSLAKEKYVAGRVSCSGHLVDNPAYGKAGEKIAVVQDPIRDTVSRECLRHEEFRHKVKLGRQMDHFIFSVESTGQWEADELVLEALKILKEKAQRTQIQVLNMIS